MVNLESGTSRSRAVTPHLKKLLNLDFIKNKKGVFLFFTFLIGVTLNSQELNLTNFDYSCRGFILETEFEVEKFDDQEYMTGFIEKFFDLQSCGLDSIDIQIIFLKPVFGRFLISLSDTLKDKIKIIDLIRKLDTLNPIEYSKIRSMLAARNQLYSSIVDDKKWKEHKALLNQLGVHENEINEIQILVREETRKGITYKKLLEEFTENNEGSEYQYSNIYSKVLRDLSINEIDELSKNINKPILIYFRNDRSINCEKLEEYVLTKREVSEIIIPNFVFVELNVNDNTILPESEQMISGKQKIETIGQRNLNFQIKEFGNNSHPLIVKLNRKGEFESMVGYVNLGIFLDFLRE